MGYFGPVFLLVGLVSGIVALVGVRAGTAGGACWGERSSGLASTCA